MISLPANQLIVEDTNEDSHISKGDIQVSLTFGEHELMMDVLMQAISAIDFACPYGIHELPLDSEIVQRYTMLDNLRERFSVLWTDRFETTTVKD